MSGERKMTCGIYKLSFLNTKKVYVGQSVNIEYRFLRKIPSGFKRLLLENGVKFFLDRSST